MIRATDGPVHLIGSVPLASTEDVFRTLAGALGDRLSRMPDGETGERRRWIWWQRAMLEHHPAMEVDRDTAPIEIRQWDGTLLRRSELFRLRSGVDPDAGDFPTGVEPGYPLCSGSPADEHLVMPRDTAILAEIGTAIFARATRPVDFLHLPVPRERDDVAYFAPLRELRRPAATRLYLGLIHWNDVTGDRRRIDPARRAVAGVGVAHECAR